MYGVNDWLSLWAVPALREDKTGGVGASGALGSHRSHQRRLGSLGQCVWPWGGGEREGVVEGIRNRITGSRGDEEAEGWLDKLKRNQEAVRVR